MGSNQKKPKTRTTEELILDLERRFKSITGISQNIGVYPIPQYTTNTSMKTNESKRVEFDEVFTPLWLVDKMIGQLDE